MNLSFLYYKDYYQNIDWHGDNRNAFQDKNRDLLNILATAESQLPSCGNVHFKLKTTYPGLLPGSGYIHETGQKGEYKLGFQFDYSLGTAVIPGSSVKGVLRSAFPQYKFDSHSPWIRKNETTNEPNDNTALIQESKASFIGELLGWAEKENALFDKVHCLELEIFEGIDINKSEVQETTVYNSIWKRDIFYDAFPVRDNGIPTKLLGDDSITPHQPLKNPIPIPFVKILPNVPIRFSFDLREENLGGVNVSQRTTLFKNILLELGVGAKTNVGYGQLVAID